MDHIDHGKHLTYVYEKTIADCSVEPLLVANPNRFVLRPIMYPDVSPSKVIKAFSNLT